MEEDLNPDPAKTNDMRDKLDSIWSAEDICREMVDLSGKFRDYRIGSVKIPTQLQQKKKRATKPAQTECTFQPQINEESQRIDQNLNARPAPGKIMHRSVDGSFTLSKQSKENNTDLTRVNQLYQKKLEVEKRLEHERRLKEEQELAGCTF